MDLDKILAFIPELLLYFVPGFVCLRIKETYGFQKKHEELGAVIYSILYSFIVLVVFTGLKAVFPEARNWFPKAQLENIKRVIFLVLGVVVGVLITVVPKLKPWKWLIGLIIPFTATEQEVWEKAMTNHKGAKAKVYLKNGVVYEGDLGYATGDPDDANKTVLIYNYKSYIRKENSKNENLIIPIKNNYKKVKKEEEMEKVYIRPDEIVSIEIDPNA